MSMRSDLPSSSTRGAKTILDRVIQQVLDEWDNRVELQMLRLLRERAVGSYEMTALIGRQQIGADADSDGEI
jgi:hypothetical protein